ncbi:MAG TPA: hypothetical protein PKE59_11385 [Novosphingobium sp.]|jgi:hypothetical protein|nr:hypothetical protein [Novosphingobium sp.]HPZ46176.1 hypothetical protein [Novosphingobium sp.]
MNPADLAAGIDPAKERINLCPPADEPGFGENHAFWIHDEDKGIQIIGHLNTSEDIGDYRQRLAKLSVSFPDGRLYQLREIGDGCSADEAGSGNLRFACIEPFRRWSCHYAGAMDDVTVVHNYRTGNVLDLPRVAIRFDVETQMVAPAWLQGSMVEGGLGLAAAYIGGERYEQLFRASGKLTVGGTEYAISGYGNRTHRYGTRDLSASAKVPPMLGHVWGAAVFPDGTGFGLQVFPNRDGTIFWGEAYVLQGGVQLPARIIAAPWLRHYHRSGERIEIILETHQGERFEISGETIASVLSLMIPAPVRGEQVPLLQSHVRYRMRGQTADNMLERSLRRSAIETGIGRPG